MKPAAAGLGFFERYLSYTLVQVSVNDLIMLILFVPIVQFLVRAAPRRRLDPYATYPS
jgi:ACR3 family arsenite efflux pump ArsB